MPGFTCPFCGQTMSIHRDTQSAYFLQFGGFVHPDNTNTHPHLRVTFNKCPNDNCRKLTAVAQGVNGYLDNASVLIHPQMIYKHFPAYVPEAIRSDYEEARLIQNRSPKASATLARRCLQGMIRDFWGITGKANLYQEIDAIKDKIPAAQWSAIDALRKVGNIGAHMEKDVNVIIDVEPGEADKLLRLIELLVDKWYVARHEEELLYNEIVDIKDTKESEKSSGDH